MTSGETLISVESNGIGIMPLATLLSSYWRADGSTKRHDAWCTQYCVASVPKIMSPRKTKADHRQPMPDLDDLDIISERTMRLNQVVTGEKFKFDYIYDMGDGWDHQILVEKVLPPDPEVRYPICIKGKQACPPEDCGGIWGYGELLEIIKDCMGWV
jgi:hypothetical protein